MSTYTYDDYRLTLTPRVDGHYDVRASGPGGTTHAGVFRVPFTDDELERAVLGVARTVTRSPGSGVPTRDIGGEPPAWDAERVGGALADALFEGDIGAGYDAARHRAAGRGRGLRLVLSMAAAPGLLSLPWELLYRRPRFLANQRHTPLVRHLEVPALPQPPAIEGTVHLLGVVASPSDCAPLDVAAERARVERAVAPVAAMGRVELDWLEPATPRRLRQALRDGSYHVLHYVGHGDVTAGGDGVLFLEDDDGGRAEVDGTELANLLADQTSLRLVVLNSCEGARTSLTDPFAGVATTLVHLGVPAVVAMQFEISDRAAILFAEELYTNLIGRQSPVDAAVAEARKAIYIEEGTVEWATPVLFMGDTDVELFRFRLEPAPLPPPPPPDTAFVTPPAAPAERRAGRRRVGRRRVAAAAAAVVGLVGGGAWILDRQDDVSDDEVAETDVSWLTLLGAGTTVPPSAAAPTSATAPSADGSAVAPVEARELAGSIDEPDGRADHPLELAAGQLLYLAGTTECGAQVAYRLRSPSGAPYRGLAPGVCADLGRVEVGETGTWQVEVEGWGGGRGPYRLVVTPVPADTVAEVTPPARLAGEVTAPGERHRYRFDATARDVVHLAGSDPCGSLTYRLVSPSGSTVGGVPGACSDAGRLELAESGTYTVAVESWDAGVGVYDLSLLPVPPDVVTTVAVGDPLVGQIVDPGAQHRYELDASAGDVVGVDGRGPCAGVTYALVSPSGTTVGGQPGVCDDLEPQQLGESGTYVLVVSSYGGGVGAYDLRLVEG